ncbi:MAG: hypothetical protein HYZ90_01055 [Candidatus Omnitrophica bacterium]|nr:hypothetical protein [Candidatus Omnitrophota bacterium]
MNPSSVSLAWLGLALALCAGCRGGFATVERPKGQIELRTPKGPVISVSLDPMTISDSRNGIDVTVRYANPQELEAFFAKKEVFGEFAGKNPYPPDTLVFYVKLGNHSGKKIRVNPDDFVMIDNLNVQYAELSPDNISALYESRASVWSFAKTTGDLAPGPYGIPLKVAGLAGGGGGRKLHYLMKQVRLAGGVVHPGIAYDGYVAFPRPHPNATSLRVVVGNIKTDFDPADLPASTVDFEFPFTLKVKHSEPEPPKS